MIFNEQEIKRIIQAPITMDIKIDLLRQLHNEDVQNAVSSVYEEIEKVYSNAVRTVKKENISFDFNGHIDPLLLDALELAKKQKLSIISLQRNLKIGYNRANRLLGQYKKVMGEEEEDKENSR